MHGREAAGETANAFDCRQTIRNLCVNGRDYCRAIGLRRSERALSCGSHGRIQIRQCRQLECRTHGLIYATVMDTRGIYMSADTAEAAKYADSLVKATDQISAVTGDWHRSVRISDALAFSNLAVRLNDYQDSLYKLAPIAKQSGPKAAREWATKNQPAESRVAVGQR